MKLLFSVAVTLFAALWRSNAEVVDYVTAVLPIMKNHCWDCHSNENSVKGNLALDDFDEIRDYQIGKFNIIRPGNPGESGFVERLKLDSTHTDFMPRKASPLPKAEIEMIEKWIEHGAVINASKPTEEEAERLSEVRKSTSSSGPEYHQWTNREGKVIEARFFSLDGDSVQLVLKNGRSYDVPLETFTPESAALARKLGEK